MNPLISQVTLKLLTLSMLKGVGPAALKKLAVIPGFENMEVEELGRIVSPVGRALDLDAKSIWSVAQDAAYKQVTAAEQHGARILSSLDPEYPSLLTLTKDDPFIVYVKGTLAKDPLKSVAIIGTREPTATGVVIAQRVARTFAEQGWSIVSGLALGCDAIAHQAALNVGGHTVAVLAHGLQMISPSRHKGLAQAILDAGGALVSEYPFGQAVQAQQFVKRDRTQAGMAQGVVMIQSDTKGGSLHASRAALDYERWLAVPYPTTKDRQNGEPKVQGNLVIADGTMQERTSLLRCQVSALDRILVLRERADILHLAGADVGGSVVRATQHDIATESKELPLGDPLSADDERDIVTDMQAILDERAVINAPELGEPAETHVASLDSDLGYVVAQEAARTAEPQAVSEVIETHAGTRRSVSKRGPRYHVTVHSAYGNHELNIIQVPHWRILEIRNTSFTTAHEHDVVITLSTRLQHLQERLDEVKRLQATSTCASDVTNHALRLQFFVEDALVHMKRSVDELVRLKAVQRVSSKIDLPALNQSHQLSFLDAGPPPIESHVDLVSALDQIVKALPASAQVCTSAGTARHKGVINIHLDELVHSFNRLFTLALDSDRSDDWERAN